MILGLALAWAVILIGFWLGWQLLRLLHKNGSVLHIHTLLLCFLLFFGFLA